jgi:hypothetical protein
LASANVEAIDTPSSGVGAAMPATSRIVGKMSIRRIIWLRMPPWFLIFAGHTTTIGLRDPPKCDATCLTHWNGALPAHAQPSGNYPAEVENAKYSSRTTNVNGHFMTTVAMRFVAERFVPPANDGRDPHASPLRAASLKGLPPTVIWKGLGGQNKE